MKDIMFNILGWALLVNIIQLVLFALLWVINSNNVGTLIPYLSSWIIVGVLGGFLVLFNLSLKLIYK